ncbi:MAG: undecaprenyl/decaprenyl-phosphate alpha-N-acetylglucosaminyl 1-phosphate transferase [Candidatus Doudnabacteria bacterium]|nr:undecaprenyl/decaprenyl-phosphate alpha-N-acetylglucosaminyl 1-phosphate transferase [Candidatus Doudnabacteria bacterium]
MRLLYFGSFALAFLVSFIATFLVSRIAMRRGVVDLPDEERRFHKRPTPTMGGIAIYASFFLVTLAVGVFGGYLLNGNIPLNILIAIWAGGAILMIGGYLDDRYRLPALQSLIFPIIACLVLVSAGVKAVTVHNPLNNQIIVLLPIFSGLVVFLWTLTMTYTTKLLDGMDGLVTGISTIAALILFGISLSPQVSQPQTALLAITFAGSLAGFLILNFYPAKIFLGEGGSTFAGFMLAVLAVVSGGKIATALLVMGIPLLDMVWVILQRLISRQSPFSGDRKHLHFKLTEIGFSEPQAVLFLYALTGIFGGSALFLQSRGKMIALIILFLVMLAIIASVFSAYRSKRSNE